MGIISNSKSKSNRDQIRQLHQQAQQFLNQKNYPQASDCCLKILAFDSRHADAHFLLGIILLHKGKIGKAIELIRKAVDFDDSNPEYYAHLAQCLVISKADKAAREAAAKALSLQPEQALTIDTIGNVYSRLGEHETAINAFEHAIRINPDNAEFHYNLASSLRFLGKFEEAENAYEKAIDCNPHHYRSYLSLSGLRKQTKDKNHIQRLQKLLDSDVQDTHKQLHLCYALAKEYEDLEDYDKSFENLSIANQIQKKSLHYTIDDDRKLFHKIQSVFDKPFFEYAHSGYSTREPIIIVGMPRTGTTLVERIIGSHSQVMSAGELQNFGLELKRLSGTPSNRILDEQTVDKALSLKFSDLGRNYIDSTRPLTGHKPYFIDKLPLNFFYIGFINLALPGAKIICLKRNAMDTCFSNYKQLFAIGFSYYNYSYDLNDIAEYYMLFNELMRHWYTVLPNKILEVQYESLVENQELETRRILEWCELKWEDACLDFHKNTTPVSTASSVQVRNPIYKSSIERWKHYKKHLQPLMHALKQGGIKFD